MAKPTETTEKKIVLTRTEREIDAALEMFIHRLAVAKVSTYEQLFEFLTERQCTDMRKSYEKLSALSK